MILGVAGHRLLDGLVIPSRCLRLVVQMEMDFAERGQEPVVMLLARLLAFTGDVGERPAGEVTGFLALTSQPRHRGGVD